MCRVKDKMIICGDLKQLPPVVMSRVRRVDLEFTLMERAMLGSQVVRVKLQFQHRYPRIIGEFVSKVYIRFVAHGY